MKWPSLIPLLMVLLAPAPVLAAERPFALQNRDGIWWLVNPAGQTFFSLGICVADQGIPRAQHDPAKPGYAAWKHYRDPQEWADQTLRRLQSWNFTTAGGWGDYGVLRTSKLMTLAMTPVLGAGMEAGAPWFDLWDAKVISRIEELARKRIEPLRDDPRLLGYYTDNEMGWWNAALFKMTLEHPASSQQRQRLVKLLRESYQNDWKNLLGDFDPDGAGSFEELESKGILFLRAGGNGIRWVRKFLELAAERYYELLASIVRRLDGRALILGDRYQSFYYPEVARAAGRHVDAISTNLNAPWYDGTLARFYLETLHQLTGKPILVSEFYMAASENRSGNPNSSGLFPVAGSQRERAESARRTLNAILSLPYVVGADWFQYYDEPPGGRFDGENYNFGLVDIEDRPYEELIAALRSGELKQLHGQPPRKRPDASSGIPPAPAEPLKDFAPFLALRHWDRERGFVAPASPLPMAELYLAWSPEALYLGLFALDIVEEEYYRGGEVPEIDRMEWMVDLEGLKQPLRLRLGAGLAPSGAPAEVTVHSLSGKKLNVRNFAALKIPARLFGRDRLAAGEFIRLSSVLTTHARAYRIEWSGRFPLSAVFRK